MTDSAEKPNRKDIDTGPQGTRVFKREDVDRYFAQRDQQAVNAGSSSGASLVGLYGVFKDLHFEIPSGRSTVGRNRTNNIVIDHDSISLVHARIFQKEDEWWVLNLLSTNGTFVNNRKVTDSLLNEGDHVRFGEAEFIFHKPRPKTSRLRQLLSALRKRFGSLFR